jgi:4-phytase/acid phosphatase
MKLALIAFAATIAAAGSAPAATPAGSASDGLRLERVVMLMRHGVRPPTKDPVIPVGYFSGTWPAWSTEIGLLTQHGADGARLVGRYDRERFAVRGLFDPAGCPAADEIDAAASAKPRTVQTAVAFLDGFAPGCTLAVDHPPEGSKDDPIFHPADSGTLTIDGQTALQAAQRQAPAGGIQAEAAAHRDDLQLLGWILGCCRPPVCPDCSLDQAPAELTAKEGDAPNIGGSLGAASTAAQTLLLEYVEGKPMSEVGWGRVTRPDIERLLAFHVLKYKYEAYPAYIADRTAAPVAKRILSAVRSPAKTKLTLLAGHDTNIAQFSGMLQLKWKSDSYPANSPAPGGALGFEVLADSAGKRYVRGFYQTQTMEQLRNLTPLSEANPPSVVYIDIPGCGVAAEAKSCTLEAFSGLIEGKLNHPAAS